MNEEMQELTPQELQDKIGKIQELTEKIANEGEDTDKVKSITLRENFVILPAEADAVEFATDVLIEEIEENGVKSYKVYTLGQELIATMTEEGLVTISPEFLEKLDENSKALLQIEARGNVMLNLEELEKPQLRDVKVEFEEKTQEEEPEKEEQTEGPASESQKEEIEADLGIEKGALAFEADIKDNRFQDIVPEAKEYIGKPKFCRIKGESEPMIIGKSKQTGTYQKFKTIGEAQKTNERPIQLDENGQEIQRENIRGIMQCHNNSSGKYALGYDIDGYGDLKLDLLREDPTIEVGYRYISCGMETRTQYPVTQQVKDFMDHTQNTTVGEEIERYEALREDHPTADINLADITDESARGIIRLSNGEITTFVREAERARVTPAEFERIYREANGATPEEKIANAHEEIERQFGAPEREHRL